MYFAHDIEVHVTFACFPGNSSSVLLQFRHTLRRGALGEWLGRLLNWGTG